MSYNEYTGEKNDHAKEWLEDVRTSWSESLKDRWHRLIVRLFKKHIDAEIDLLTHPHFGSIWMPEGEGGRREKEAYWDGYQAAYSQFKASGELKPKKSKSTKKVKK